MTKMDELSKRFPKGVEYGIVYDTTMFVSASMEDVLITLGEAHGPRHPGGLRLPAELARHAHSSDRHPGFADRHAGHHVCLRLLAEHGQHARPGAGDRPGGR